MPKELPLACSLDAAELPERLAQMAELGRSSLLTMESAERRAVLRFRLSPGTAERLATIVAAEEECCAFMTMNLARGPDAVELTIGAPPGAEPVLAEMVHAFGG